MNINDTKLNVLLDLFEAGYNNACVSVMNCDLHSQYIEIFLPNVGSLRLCQSFDETLDVQIPHIDIFYVGPVDKDPEIKIQNAELLNRAARLIYKTKKYFEHHPEYIVKNTDLIKRIQNNQNIAKKQYEQILKKQRGWLGALRQK